MEFRMTPYCSMLDSPDEAVASPNAAFAAASVTLVSQDMVHLRYSEAFGIKILELAACREHMFFYSRSQVIACCAGRSAPTISKLSQTATVKVVNQHLYIQCIEIACTVLVYCAK